MARRLSAIAFVLALFAIVACGHQVTPNPTASQNDLTGDIVVKFQTQGALDFTDLTYVIAIDSCGTGVPYPQAYTTGFTSYTYTFVVGGAYGSAEPELIQYYVPPGGGGLARLPALVLNPSQAQFVPNYSGNANEFELIFSRSLLNDPRQVQYPCPQSSVQDITYGTATQPSATPTPTASASASSSAGPTATPTATPNPSGTGTPAPGTYSLKTGVQVPPYLTSWTFNMLVFQGTTPLDSLGIGGAFDTSFQGLIVDTTSLSTPYTYPAPTSNVPSNSAALITYGEVDSYP